MWPDTPGKSMLRDEPRDICRWRAVPDHRRKEDMQIWDIACPPAGRATTEHCMGRAFRCTPSTSPRFFLDNCLMPGLRPQYEHCSNAASVPHSHTAQNRTPCATLYCETFRGNSRFDFVAAQAAHVQELGGALAGRDATQVRPLARFKLRWFLVALLAWCMLSFGTFSGQQKLDKVAPRPENRFVPEGTCCLHRPQGPAPWRDRCSSSFFTKSHLPWSECNVFCSLRCHVHMQ